MPTTVFHTNGAGDGGDGGSGGGAQRPCVELTHAPLDRNALTQHAPLLLEAQSLEQPAPSQKIPVLLTLHVAACRRRASPASGTGVGRGVGPGVGGAQLGHSLHSAC